MRFVIVTGMSGAGKSHAIHCMEDMGYYCIDNMPPVLIDKFAELCYQSLGKMDHVALVMDLRGGDLFEQLVSELAKLKEKGYNYEILFLDSSDETLIRRYKQTRRRHPLSAEGGSVSDGLAKERERLSEIKKMADYVVDTTDTSSSKLKRIIVGLFSEDEVKSGMSIDVVSFGFKHGILLDADLVFDVRFLPNPFYIDELKEKTGMDKEVYDYVMGQSHTKEFCAKLADMIDFLIPHYIEEGKAQLVIAIGCTGGKHRSVAIAEWLAEYIEKTSQFVSLTHRDVQKLN